MFIRNMMESDFQEIKEIIYNSFLEYESDTKKIVRSEINLMYNLMLYKNGCFVATINSKIAGFVFSKKFGSVGWIGILAVSPRYKGQGIGKSLIKKTIRTLKADKCKIIGLETMAFSPYNLGMYSKLGFNSITPNYLISKFLTVNRVIDKTQFNLRKMESLSELISIKEICNKTGLDIDFSSTAEVGFKYDCIKSYFLENKSGTTIGFINISTKHMFENHKLNHLKIENLVLIDRDKDNISLLLNALETLVKEYGYSKIILPINSMFTDLLSIFLKNGYEVTKHNVRMVKTGNYSLKKISGIELSRWAM